MLPNLLPDEKSALQKAMKLCASEERSPSYIQQKFIQWGLNKQQSETLLNYLVQKNFLNEKRYAEAFVRGKFKIKGWGKIKIKAELQSRGISSEVITQALLQLKEDPYLETLQKLAYKKLQSLKGIPSDRQQQKLIRYLLSKGYEYEQIVKVLEVLGNKLKSK